MGLLVGGSWFLAVGQGGGEEPPNPDTRRAGSSKRGQVGLNSLVGGGVTTLFVYFASQGGGLTI